MNYRELMDLIIKEYDNQTKWSKIFDDCTDKLKLINIIVEKYNCEFDDALIIAEYFIDDKPLPSNLSPQQIVYNNQVAREWQNKPKCPTCGSTNVSKISATVKVADTVMFGIFGQKRKHQFKCLNCRYEW